VLDPLEVQIKQVPSFKSNALDGQNRNNRIDQIRNAIREGWGKTYRERIHKKGKLTAHERTKLLADKPDDIFPILQLVNFGETFHDGKEERLSPGAGVLTAFVRVHGRWCIVIANDNTVASGSWWPKTPEKIIRAQDIALKLKLPVIYLVDCSGLFLPEQAKTFPGRTGAGHIFYKNSILSNQGIPQIAGVFGDCIAGGGYMPIISDKVFMTEQAYMVIAGAALIKGAKSQHLSSLDIGGPNIHVRISDCADERVADDKDCLKRIREEIAKTASSAVEYYRDSLNIHKAAYKSDFLDGIMPKDPNQNYDMKQVLACLIDQNLFWEILPNTGHEVLTGLARIGGLYVGIAANVQGLLPHPHKKDQKRLGGILYREGVAKLSTFVRALNADGIPLIWLQDIAGFDVGENAEKQGLLGYGSSLIYANSTVEIPVISILLRKASGAGYYAMSGLPYEPVIQLATPHTRLAVMEGKTLAIGAFNTKLDDNFQIATKDPKERAEIEKGMNELASRIEKDMDPIKAAAQMDVDELIKLEELRSYLEILIEASYQSQGTRRIKNPRIWSLHDLQILTQYLD